METKRSPCTCCKPPLRLLAALAVFAFAATNLVLSVSFLLVQPPPGAGSNVAVSVGDFSADKNANGGTESVDLDRLRHRTVGGGFGDSLLTIAVDDYKSCPDLCGFIHTILPDDVRFRYVRFDNHQSHGVASDDPPYHLGIEAALGVDGGADDSHVFIVTRRMRESLGRWAELRRRMGTSVGLFLMADEDGDAEYVPHYPLFDYVIRNYYFPTASSPFPGMALRALGNQSCGTSPPLPVEYPATEPRWGLHWSFLFPREFHVLHRRAPSAVWPTSRRPTNCSFIGRKGVKASREERLGLNKTAVNFPELNCDVSFYEGFAKGNGPFDYISDLADSKVGLNPIGSHVECHRLPEMLYVGTVPAMIEQEYASRTFRPVPAVTGKYWEEVLENVQSLVEDDLRGGKRLSDLSKDGALWMEELVECMKSDMAFILHGAFQRQQRQQLVEQR